MVVEVGLMNWRVGVDNRTSLDSFKSIFDLEDVSIGGEDYSQLATGRTEKAVDCLSSPDKALSYPEAMIVYVDMLEVLSEAGAVLGRWLMGEGVLWNCVW